MTVTGLEFCFWEKMERLFREKQSLMLGTVQQNVDWIVDMGEKQRKGLKK